MREHCEGLLRLLESLNFRPMCFRTSFDLLLIAPMS
jgi:hypothetical protein